MCETDPLHCDCHEWAEPQYRPRRERDEAAEAAQEAASPAALDATAQAENMIEQLSDLLADDSTYDHDGAVALIAGALTEAYGKGWADRADEFRDEDWEAAPSSALDVPSLKEFAEWVADLTNDPAIFAEATRIAAALSRSTEEQNR